MFSNIKVICPQIILLLWKMGEKHTHNKQYKKYKLTSGLSWEDFPLKPVGLSIFHVNIIRTVILDSKPKFKWRRTFWEPLFPRYSAEESLPVTSLPCWEMPRRLEFCLLCRCHMQREKTAIRKLFI